MEDRNIAFCQSRACAWGVAATAIALMCLSTLQSSANLRGWALVVTGAAVVACIRRYFIIHSERVDRAFKESAGAQERAFMCGIEAGRAQAQIPQPRTSGTTVRPLQPH